MHGHPLKPLAVLLLLPFCAPARTYHAASYDVQLQLDTIGHLDVTETVVFRFYGPFTFVYRNINAAHTDGITDVRAWFDGNPCPRGTEPGEAEISGDSLVKVRWHFANRSDEAHTFTVRYRALGVLRNEVGGRTLTWRALPPDREYSIESSEIVLSYPEGNRPQSVSLGDTRVEAGTERAVLHLGRVPAGKTAILTAQFASGSFAVETPHWQSEADARGRDFLSGLSAGALLAAIAAGLAAIWMARMRTPRGSAFTDQSGVTIQQPPDSLRPALAARLTGRAGGPSGILLDLARRNVLRIEEGPRGFFKSCTFRIALTARPADLAPHEDLFLSALFRDGETTASLRDFGSRVLQRRSKLDRAVASELDAAGLIDAERSSRRKRLLFAGALAMVVGLAFLGLGIVSATSSFAGVAGAAAVVGGAVAAIGMAALVMGSVLSRFTDTGEMAAARWKSFARHLSEVSRGRFPLPAAGELDRMLAYAAAFGIAAPLLKLRQKQADIPLPPWFAALDADGGSDAFVAFLSYSDASAATGGDGGSGGDGGASGGGSSGAG